MGFERNNMPNKGSKYENKNKSVQLYKKKKSKIELFKKEVEELTKKVEEFDPSKVEKFDDFPLSEGTKTALKKANFITPTEIQKDSIGLALKGHDILGAAKTGSGKTLAFIIPLLEYLYRSGWTTFDGLGALIITPTRELAYQIFAVINKVGERHQFSVALVIGGKDLDQERKTLNKCNILICTPGRLLQHMDENPLFEAMNLKILVLDEADKILDLGFEKTVNAIIDHLPVERQTLLFSATQTKSVKDLARLSLKNPVYVSVHEHAKHSTPESLHQNYIVCDADSKINLLWSFIKSHKQQKTLVFMATCKQVKYVYESFCRMRPGISLMALYGSLHQLRRMKIYDEFCRKNHVVLFATDIASRGLDFPNVSWVVQLDCPEDTNTYIHRVGRTARYQKNGQSLLVLLPSEKDSMVEQLQKSKIPIEEQKVNPLKLQSIQKKLEAMCARDVNLKESAQRAYKAYVKNIILMKDKTVFDVTKIDIDLYARSLGLPFAPRNRFLEKHSKCTARKAEANEFGILNAGDSGDDSDEELFVSKPVQEPASEEPEEKPVEDVSSKKKKPLTKAAIAKRILKKNIQPNVVLKFDDDGNPCREICGKLVPVVTSELQEEMFREGYSIEKAKLIKEKEEQVDRMLFRHRIKLKHMEERLKNRKQRKEEQGGAAPQLPSDEEDAKESSDEEIDPNNLMGQNSSSGEDDESDSEHQASGVENLASDAEYLSSDTEHLALDSEQPILSSEFEKSDKISKKRKAEHLHAGIKKKLNPAEKLLSSDQSLEEAEQLALHFLSNS